MSYWTRVAARRCTVLFASPRRAASALIPNSNSSSENALVRRMAFATDDSRALRGRGFFTRSISKTLILLCGTTIQLLSEHVGGGDARHHRDPEQRAPGLESIARGLRRVTPRRARRDDE